MPRTSRRPSKKQRVSGALRERGWESVDAQRWAELKSALPDVSESTMRDALRDSGVEVLQPWRGVEQHTLEELELSLRALTQVYLREEPLRLYCRRLVIEAKNRARWASQNRAVEAGKRESKAEMVDWMLIWLGDPSVFPGWVELRRKQKNLPNAQS